MKINWMPVMAVWLMLAGTVAAVRTFVFSETCPRDYDITKPDGNVLNIQLYQSDQKYCKKVEKLKKKLPRGGYDFQKDLDKPFMTPVIRGNMYMATVELSLPSNSDGKYPRSVYLELVAYNRSQEGNFFHMDTQCLYLNITNSTGDPDWDPLKFSFTCMELIEDPGHFLVFTMQLWTLPSRRRSQLCRKTRAIAGGQRSCGVRCSEEAMFPLTLAGENAFSLCACADKRRLNSTISSKGPFDRQKTVKIEGLPPLIGPIHVRVVKEDSTLVFKNNLDTTGIRDGIVQFVVTQSLEPGNYSIFFDAECEFSRPTTYREEEKQKQGILNFCPDDDIHAVDFFHIEEYQDEFRIPVVAVLLVVILVFAVVFTTCLVYIFLHKMRQKSYNASSGEKPTCNNQLQTFTTSSGCHPHTLVNEESTLESSLPLLPHQLECNLPSTDKTQTDLDQRQNDLGHRQTELGHRQTELGHRQTDLGHRQTEQDHRQTGMSHRNTDLGQRQSELGHRHTDLGHRQTDLGPRQTELGHRQTELGHRQTDSTMLLYHCDSERHLNCVQNLISASHRRGVKMKTVSDDNWRDFAEGATDHYRNIVIVLSKKLNQLLKCYKDGIDSELFRSLMIERHQEYSPCIVMDKIRMRVHEKVKTKLFTLHVVTVCESMTTGNGLIDEFLKVHDYLKRTDNCKIYNFTDAASADKDQFISLIESI